MPVVVLVDVISLIVVAVMIRSAITVGFTVLVVPILLAELAFVGAVYLVWRGIEGDEHPSESVETARPDRGRRPAPSFRPHGAARPAADGGLHGRSLVGRTGG